MVSLKTNQEKQALRPLDKHIFRLMFEKHAAIMLLVDPQSGSILDANQAAAAFYGYPLAKLRGMSIATINMLAPEQVKLDRLKALENQKNCFVFPHKLASGEVRMVEVHSTAIFLEQKQLLFSIIHDVTERFQAEQTLQKSEAFYRSLFDNLNGFTYCRMLFQDGKPSDFICLTVNKAFEDLTGLKDICGKKFSQVMPGIRNTNPELFDIFWRVTLTGEPEHFETFLEGLQTWFSVSVHRLAPEHFVAVFDPITAKKQLEKAALENSERLREVLENSLDASYKRDLSTNTYAYLSPVFTRISGYTPEELKALPTESVLDLIHPKDIAEVERVLDASRSVAAGTAVHIDYRFKHKDGQYRWFHDQFTVLRDAQGQPAVRIGSVQDITERKLAEENLRKNEQKYQVMVTAMSEGFIMQNEAGEIKLSNPAVEKILGLTSDQMNGLSLVDPRWRPIQPDGTPFPDGEHPGLLTLRSGKAIYDVEMGLHNPTGELTWININSVPIFNPGETHPYAVVSTLTDKTQSKQIETALRESEQKYHQFFEQSSDGIAMSDETGRVLEWNSALEQITGFRRDQVIGRNFIEIQSRLMTPKASAQVLERQENMFRLALQTGSAPFLNTILEVSFQSANGETRFVNQMVFPVKTQKGFRLGILSRDITERKRTEDALQRVSRQLSSIIESTGDGIAMLDTEHRYALFNSAFHSDFKQLFGQDLKPGDSLPQALAHLPGDLADVMEHWKRALNGEDFTVTQLFGDPALERKWYELHFSPIRDNQGKVISAVHIVRNVTDRKRMEEILRESEERFRHMADTAPALIWQSGTDSQSDYFNQPWLEFTGRSLDQEIGNGWTEGIHPDDYQKCVDTYHKAFKAREKTTLEYRLRRFDGEYIWMLDTAVPRFTPDGTFLGFIDSCIDINPLKKLEQELQTQRDFATQIIDTMGQGLTVSDNNGRFEFVNPAYAALIGYESTALIGKHPRELTIPEDHELLNEQRRLRQLGKTTTYESHLLRVDGSIAPVSITGVPRKFESNGVSSGSIAVVTDLTAQKRIEAELLQAKAALELAFAHEQELARTDELTGINNRRHLFELAEHKLAVASRYQQSLAIMLFDIDHFKHVNDLFGHLIGDQILKKVVGTAFAELRSVDVIGRYGGEEFIILLPMTNAQQAYLLAERIRTGVEKLKVPTDKGNVSVSLSIGIVEINLSLPTESLEDLFHRADTAMYNAKFTGRNRTVISASK
ncbi:MAG: PAS domain S-box protein [Chloroflexi bacterium]|nr:PAS domain S-box protein [Chloroflexota bacterium]